MPQALLISRRAPRLGALLGSLRGPGLAIASRDEPGRALAETGPLAADLLVVDACSVPAAQFPLLAALRARLPGVPCLLIASADRPDVLRQALATSPDALLLDPFDLDLASQTLHRLLPEDGTGTGRESLEALAIVLKGLAHEVLNPLTSVSGILQILQHEEPVDSERAARYRTMQDGVARIQRTLRELEHFVRSRKPQRRLLDPTTLLEELRRSLEREQPPLTLSVHAGPGAPPVLADRQHLLRALEYLARFAAGPDGSAEVRAELRRERDRVCLELHGTPRVPLPEEPSRLFIPYQDHAAGLQLPAAYGILRSHRGSLDIAPEGEDGVRLRILIPAASVLEGGAG